MKLKENPEPVPPASQITVLPFLAAVEGYLRGADPHVDIRLTMHRLMNREGQEYLQQICSYLGSSDASKRSGAGRMFPVTTGIMGGAFQRRRVLHTKFFARKEELFAALQRDMQTTGEKRDIHEVSLSWLAVPFLGPDGEPVLVLYADSFQPNFFSDISRVQTVVDMCWGFVRLLDGLARDPIPRHRNFGFESGSAVTGAQTMYPTLQEELPNLSVPQFEELRSFNYETPPA
jgi:hypothetical protein